jgi:hypothetical protein
MRTLLATIALCAAVAVQAAAPPLEQRRGATRVDGRAIADADGPFAALGATLFWAAWAYKHDRPRLDAHLRLLAEHRFDYIRALGVVGRQPYWKGREIDWRWPDYDEIIAGLTDHAYDRHGLRVEWTIFADADQVIPNAADRERLVDRFLAMSAGREHKIMHFELANESWQNGFAGEEGIAQLRALTRRLTAQTTIPVAVSASDGHACDDHLQLYRGLDIEIITEHFDRDVRGPLGRWGPVAATWTIRNCPGLPPVISNNEPIGPRSSVESETEPHYLLAGAVASYMASVGLYVFHTDAGVWGREPLADMPGAPAMLRGFAAMKQYLPPDIATWRRHTRESKEHVFDSTGGVELFASVRQNRFVALAIGLDRPMTIRPRAHPVSFDVLDLLTGEPLARHDLDPGESLTLSGRPAVVLAGRMR